MQRLENNNKKFWSFGVFFPLNLFSMYFVTYNWWCPKQSYIHKHAAICDIYIYMYNVNELSFGLLDVIICIHENKMIITRDEEDVNSSL